MSQTSSSAFTRRAFAEIAAACCERSGFANDNRFAVFDSSRNPAALRRERSQIILSQITDDQSGFTIWQADSRDEELHLTASEMGAGLVKEAHNYDANTGRLLNICISERRLNAEGAVSDPTSPWLDYAAGWAAADVGGVFDTLYAGGRIIWGLFSDEGPEISFGRNDNQVYHTFRHVDEIGVDRSQVQIAVEQDISANASIIVPGKPYNAVVTVGGQNLQYTAFRLPDGTISVGRIHGVP